MKTETNVEHSIEFLRWLFGSEPDGYLYIWRTRPSSDPTEAKQNKWIVSTATLSVPDKLDNMWWEDNADKWSQTFSTALLHDKNLTNKVKNCTIIPALWCDIDATKKLDIPGEEFYSELRSEEPEVSCYARSSENGIQLYWKLTEPYEVVDGDTFKEDLRGLLLDIVYYYGGDPAVCTCGRLMRLPGSLNIKQEYTNYFMAKARWNDNVYSLKKLKKRFAVDENTVPKIVSYGITRLLNDVWTTGARHDLVLQLCGTVRKNGMNREACARLLSILRDYYQDDSDRATELGTTYDLPLDEIATLRKDFEAIATPIEKIVKFWCELKVIFCDKRLGFRYNPENVDPTKPNVVTGDFFENELETWFHGPKGEDECFANFIVRLKGKVIKADTYASVWLAEILMKGEVPTLVEISTDRHSRWDKFLSSPGFPVGMTVKEPKLWAHYIGYLAAQCPNDFKKETPHYGWLDIQKGEPTLIMPSTQSSDYVWSGSEDTAARPHILEQDIDRREAQKYLKRFIEYYSEYHEDRLIWPTLGWFAACAIKPFIWEILKGFPTLMITGLSGSGKSYLIKEVLAMNYGAKNATSYPGSTSYSLRKQLVSNNICPLVIDEYRDLNEKRTSELLEIVRSLYDGLQTMQGRSTGEVRKEQYQTPLCLIGEQRYTDEAAVQRSIIIQVDRSFLTNLRKQSPEYQEELRRKQAWLQRYDNCGKLGSLLVSFARNNVALIPELITASHEISEATCPSTLSRKRVGCSTLITGNKLMRSLCNNYDVDYTLKKTRMLQSIYSADVTLTSKDGFDVEALKQLFNFTDQVIIDGLRLHAAHAGSLYLFDLDEPDRYIYIDMNRWHRVIRPYVRTSESPTLIDRSAFEALLRDNQQQKNSPFVTFIKNHPALGHCVKVDMVRVQELFGINVKQWKGLVDFSDEV